MFSGVIKLEGNKLIGHMIGYFGKSVLKPVTILPDSISFTKKYDKRPDTIFYVFNKEGNL